MNADQLLAIAASIKLKGFSDRQPSTKTEPPAGADPVPEKVTESAVSKDNFKLLAEAWNASPEKVTKSGISDENFERMLQTMRSNRAERSQ